MIYDLRFKKGVARVKGPARAQRVQASEHLREETSDRTPIYEKIFIPTLALIFFLFITSSAYALKMLNTFYIINSSTLNSVSGESEGGGNKLDITIGENGAGFYSGPNYKIRAGFEYMHPNVAFAFTIIGTRIDFGALDPGSPVTRTNQLVVSNGSAYGYQVTAQEDHALLNPSNGKFIPDTTCDNGVCTPTSSDIWTNTLTYGFGYRCDNISGTDCASGFTPNYYKQFAASPSAAVVMSSTSVGRGRTAQITYKVNIAATQEAGLYGNYIMYIATPKF